MRKNSGWGPADHDVSQNITALLQYIRDEPPFKILDFGCGPDATSGCSPNWVTSQLVWKVPHTWLSWLAPTAAAKYGGRRLLKLDLPENHFDGIFANAALFHVPSQSCRGCCWN